MVASRRHPLFFFLFCRWIRLLPGIRAWSPPGGIRFSFFFFATGFGFGPASGLGRLPPRRRPRPDAGQQPPVRATNKKKAPSSQERAYRREKCPIQKKASRQKATSVPRNTFHPRKNAPRRSGHRQGKTCKSSEPGREGDPRNAGAPQQARISPAKREDARRFAPCGERRTRYTTCDSDARRHTRQGGVRGS